MAESASSSPRRALNVVFLLLMIAAGAAGVYLADRLYYAPLREQQRLIADLKTVVEQLTRDIRVAQVTVVSQTADPLTTTLKFVEVDANEQPLSPPQTFSSAGDEAYFDALVIKFEDSFTPLRDLPLKREEVAEPLKHKAIIFFRRVFSDRQKPEDGFAIDTPGQAPGAYQRAGPPSGFAQQLWAQFWELANNPALAKEHGIRAAHGQAVSMKLRKGKYYVIEQRVSGDMTIRPVEVPAVLKNN